VGGRGTGGVGREEAREEGREGGRGGGYLDGLDQHGHKAQVIAAFLEELSKHLEGGEREEGREGKGREGRRSGMRQ